METIIIITGVSFLLFIIWCFICVMRMLSDTNYLVPTPTVQECIFLYKTSRKGTVLSEDAMKKIWDRHYTMGCDPYFKPSRTSLFKRFLYWTGLKKAPISESDLFMKEYSKRII